MGKGLIRTMRIRRCGVVQGLEIFFLKRFFLCWGARNKRVGAQAWGQQAEPKDVLPHFSGYASSSVAFLITQVIGSVMADRVSYERKGDPI